MAAALANLIIPHYCCVCGEIGSILCDSCINDIISEPFNSCLVCLQPIANRYGLCEHHKTSAMGASVVGWRRDGLEKLVGASKFTSNRAGCIVQAELLCGILPSFTESVSVVPVPTIMKHRRQRGYGHAELIAKNIAVFRNYRYENIVERRGSYVQHNTSRVEREKQAKNSFVVDKHLNPDRIYILVDDVYTTGATAHAITGLLRRAGARQIWWALTTRQPVE
jgi:ComF family protein